MVVKKKKIDVDGQEIEVPVFDTKITPGEELGAEVLDKLLKEEQIEKEIQKIIEKIKTVKKKFKDIRKNIGYFYEVGKLLQFVDKKGFRTQRGKIWQRIARDLAPDLFLFDTKKKPQESKRYPEFMYLIAKVPKKFLKRASWDQWYEIMKFKDIYKKRKLLKKILTECKTGISGPTLRHKIKTLIKTREATKI